MKEKETFDKIIISGIQGRMGKSLLDVFIKIIEGSLAFIEFPKNNNTRLGLELVGVLGKDVAKEFNERRERILKDDQFRKELEEQGELHRLEAYPKPGYMVRMNEFSQEFGHFVDFARKKRKDMEDRKIQAARNVERSEKEENDIESPFNFLEMGKKFLRLYPQIDKMLRRANEMGISYHLKHIPALGELKDDDYVVIIDFSHPDVTLRLLEESKEFGIKKFKWIIGTTGFSDEALKKIEEYAKETTIFMSANFSYPVSALDYLLKKAAGNLFDGYDVEIKETHHRDKLDGPSGTAKMLAKTVQNARRDIIQRVIDFGEKRARFFEKKAREQGNLSERESAERRQVVTLLERYKKEMDKVVIKYRNAENKKPVKGEIGVSFSRGAGVVGQHSVHFYDDDSEVVFSHTAHSRSIFSRGVFEFALAFVCYKVEAEMKEQQREGGRKSVETILDHLKKRLEEAKEKSSSDKKELTEGLLLAKKDLEDLIKEVKGRKSPIYNMEDMLSEHFNRH